MFLKYADQTTRMNNSGQFFQNGQAFSPLPVSARAVPSVGKDLLTPPRLTRCPFLVPLPCIIQNAAGMFPLWRNLQIPHSGYSVLPPCPTGLAPPLSQRPGLHDFASTCTPKAWPPPSPPYGSSSGDSMSPPDAYSQHASQKK